MRIENTFKFYQGEFVFITILDNEYEVTTKYKNINQENCFMLSEINTDILIYDTKFYLTLERWNKILGKRYKQ